MEISGKYSTGRSARCVEFNRVRNLACFVIMAILAFASQPLAAQTLVSLSKTASILEYREGASVAVTYTLILEANSNVPGVAVQDQLPANVTFNTWSAPGCTPSSGTGAVAANCDVVGLSQLVINVQATIGPNSTGDVTNTASITLPAGDVCAPASCTSSATVAAEPPPVPPLPPPPCAAGETPTLFATLAGVQHYTVPPGVTSLHIFAAGAQGGGPVGGLGALVETTFSVTPGETLALIVGGDPGGAGPSGGGGGGGTFIGAPDFTYVDPTNADLLVVAGGGGGGYVSHPGGNAGIPGSDGQDGSAGGGPAGLGGSGSGVVKDQGGQGNSGGGATFGSDGPVGSGGSGGGGGAGGNGGGTASGGCGGTAAIGGGAGGDDGFNAPGGFGGGGCGVSGGSGSSGGGGGGFAGGGGGTLFGASGGGGSSFVRSDGTVGTTSVTQTGSGYALICAAIPPPTLTIHKAASIATYTQGTSTPVTYVLTVSDTAVTDVTGVAVQDSAPANVSFDSWSAPGCTPANGSGSIATNCDITAHSLVDITIQATIGSVSTGDVINNASITPPPGAICVAPSANCTASVTVSGLPQPSLTIAKTASIGSYTQGTATNLTYTLTVSDTSATAATGVAVQDSAPANTTFASWSAPGCTPASGTGAVATSCDIAGNGSATVTVQATISAAATSNVTNSATITPPPGAVCVAPSPNCTTSVTTTVVTAPPTPTLTVAKTASIVNYTVGTATSVTYTLTVADTSSIGATGVGVQDAAPTGVTFASWSAPGCAPASGSGTVTTSCTVAGNGSITIAVQATISATATGDITNTVTIAPPNGATCATPSDSCSATVTVTGLITLPPVIEPAPTLSTLMMILLGVLMAAASLLPLARRREI